MSTGVFRSDPQIRIPAPWFAAADASTQLFPPYETSGPVPVWRDDARATRLPEGAKIATLIAPPATFVFSSRLAQLSARDTPAARAAAGPLPAALVGRLARVTWIQFQTPQKPYIPIGSFTRDAAYYRTPETRVAWEVLGPWFTPFSPAYVPPSRVMQWRSDDRTVQTFTPDVLAFRYDDVPPSTRSMPVRAEEARRDTQVEWFAPFAVVATQYVFPAPVLMPQLRDQPQTPSVAQKVIAFRFDDVPPIVAQPAALLREPMRSTLAAPKSLAQRYDDVPPVITQPAALLREPIRPTLPLPNILAFRFDDVPAPVGQPGALLREATRPSLPLSRLLPFHYDDVPIQPTQPAAYRRAPDVVMATPTRLFPFRYDDVPAPINPTWLREATRYGLIVTPYTVSSDTLPAGLLPQPAALLRPPALTILPSPNLTEPRRDSITVVPMPSLTAHLRDVATLQPRTVDVYPPVTFLPFIAPPLAYLRDTTTIQLSPNQVLPQTPTFILHTPVARIETREPPTVGAPQQITLAQTSAASVPPTFVARVEVRDPPVVTGPVRIILAQTPAALVPPVAVTRYELREVLWRQPNAVKLAETPAAFVAPAPLARVEIREVLWRQPMTFYTPAAPFSAPELPRGAYRRDESVTRFVDLRYTASADSPIGAPEIARAAHRRDERFMLASTQPTPPQRVELQLAPPRVDSAAYARDSRMAWVSPTFYLAISPIEFVPPVSVQRVLDGERSLFNVPASTVLQPADAPIGVPRIERAAYLRDAPSLPIAPTRSLPEPTFIFVMGISATQAIYLRERESVAYREFVIRHVGFLHRQIRPGSVCLTLGVPAVALDLARGAVALSVSIPASVALSMPRPAITLEIVRASVALSITLEEC